MWHSRLGCDSGSHSRGGCATWVLETSLTPALPRTTWEGVTPHPILVRVKGLSAGESSLESSHRRRPEHDSLGTRIRSVGSVHRRRGIRAQATGGRGGSVYVVTNLNNSGAGSFRDAVSQSNRTIVFAVSGYADITSPITASSNLTILGQTAPGGGFGVYGAEVSFYGKSNDIVQYMRFRDTSQDPGGTGTGNSSGNCVNLGICPR